MQVSEEIGNQQSEQYRLRHPKQPPVKAVQHTHGTASRAVAASGACFQRLFRLAADPAAGFLCCFGRRWRGSGGLTRFLCFVMDGNDGTVEAAVGSSTLVFPFLSLYRALAPFLRHLPVPDQTMRTTLKQERESWPPPLPLVTLLWLPSVYKMERGHR